MIQPRTRIDEFLWKPCPDHELESSKGLSSEDLDSRYDSCVNCLFNSLNDVIQLL
jgi:hypothetical protein